MSDADSFIPPASFEFLVFNLVTQAQVQLGILHMPGETEKLEPNLPLAQHAIDLLAMMETKTKGNLEMAEKRLLENSLTELRFRFVQVKDELAKRAPAPPADAAKPEQTNAGEAGPAEA